MFEINSIPIMESHLNKRILLIINKNYTRINKLILVVMFVVSLFIIA